MTPNQIAARSGWSLRAVQMWFDEGLANQPVRTRGGMGRGAAWEDVLAHLRKTGREVKEKRRSSGGEETQRRSEEGAERRSEDGGKPEPGALDFSAGEGRTETQVAVEFERRLRQAIDQLMPVDAATGRVRLEIDGTGDADRLSGAIRKLSGELRLLAEHRQNLEERNKDVVARAEVVAAWTRFGTQLVAELMALGPDLAREVGVAAAAIVPVERAEELRRAVALAVEGRTTAARKRIAEMLRAAG